MKVAVLRKILTIAATLLVSASATAQAGFTPDSAAESRRALTQALRESRQAEARSVRLEREAEGIRDAAERTAHEAAALAARIQQAEAGVSAAEARLAIAASSRASLREELGREQQPLVHLTAALQQFTRRPATLAMLRPGSIRDTVYLRAMLDGAMPGMRQRTSGLRSRIAEMSRLRDEAAQALASLRAEEGKLALRREELAALETRQRLALRTTSSDAGREAERALALAEQARDLDALVGELNRAGNLRARLAALPGPLLRPARPEEAGLSADASQAVETARAEAPPAPYILPVAGKTIAGFGARDGTSTSQGITFAPRGGAQVVSPADGRIAFAGPYRGYGRIVIIEHPGGWTSLLTGLARTDIAVGSAVVSGAPLGTAGQNQPEVTLELRHEGEPVNPLRFVG